jgi:molybdate transport system regulatory protein
MKRSKPDFNPLKKDKTPNSPDKKNGYELKGRLWIEGRDGTFLGYGRVVLLERIKQYGSISEAARSMDMSYRHAWELVDSMNRQAKVPLVETVTGGRGGGGAKLTEAGERAIETFWRLYERFKGFLREEVKELEI